MNDIVEANKNQRMYGIDELERMAVAVASSKLFGMKSKEEAFVLMLIAQAEGQHPATITQDYDIIQGKPARKTNSVLARYQASGGVVAWETLTDQEARAKFTHKSSGSVTINWTLEMARRAGLGEKDVWKKFPRAMLRSRVIAEGVRASFPAAIGGMLVVEEAQDIPVLDITSDAKPTVEMPTGKTDSAAIRVPTPTEGQVLDVDANTGEVIKPMTDGQRKMLRAKMNNAALTDIDLKAKFGRVLDDESWVFSEFAAVQAWVSNPAGE